MATGTGRGGPDPPAGARQLGHAAAPRRTAGAAAPAAAAHPGDRGLDAAVEVDADVPGRRAPRGRRRPARPRRSISACGHRRGPAAGVHLDRGQARPRRARRPRRRSRPVRRRRPTRRPAPGPAPRRRAARARARRTPCPAMSQSAWSMPATALESTGPAPVEAALGHHLPVVLDTQRVLADEVFGEYLDRGPDDLGAALDDRLAPADDALVGATPGRTASGAAPGTSPVPRSSLVCLSCACACACACDRLDELGQLCELAGVGQCRPE